MWGSLLAIHEATGIPLAEGLDTVIDLPHTLTNAILYRKRIDSFNELPKAKRPPRKLWDRPYELGKYLDTVWDKEDKPTGTQFYEYDLEEIE